MQCNHVEVDITNGRFKVGDRVTRPIRFRTQDLTEWGDDLLKSGTVIRAYSQTGCVCGPYPELYDVRWDEPYRMFAEDGYEFNSSCFLPHGLDHENVFKATYWILHPELLKEA